jgi:hypothetical protein
MQAMVDAVPMVLQVPAERDMPASADMNWCMVISPALTCSCSCQTAVPEPMSFQLTVQHRAAGHDDGRQVDRGSAHQQGRGGLVAAHQQYHGIHRIAADGFFHVHAGQVTGQHGGWAQVGFAVGEHREFNRVAARFQDALLDVLRELAEVGVARGQFGPGIADANDWLAAEFVIRNALVLHPAPVHEAVFVLRPEPFGRAQFYRFLCL